MDEGPHDVQALCLRCGLCCDGTVFRLVALSRAEEEVARRAQLPIVQHADAPALAQPCAALETDGRCRIYRERPAHCSGYTCVAYRRYQSGELSFDEAASKIERFKKLASALRARVTDRFVGFEEIQRLIAARDDDTVAWRMKNGELLMDLVAFARICESDFGARRV